MKQETGPGRPARSLLAGIVTYVPRIVTPGEDREYDVVLLIDPSPWGQPDVRV